MADVPWIVRFVDSPETDRVVRFDCNSGTEPGQVYTRADGFTLGTTEYLVSLVESMLADDARGDQVTAARRSNREVVVPMTIVGETDDFATAMGALSREIDRGRTYLEFKPGEHTGESWFFTVKQGDIEQVELDNDEDGPNEWGVQVTLLCEPVAIGLPVESTPVAISNNPASGQVLILPTIRGDVATPLNVQLANTGLPAEGATALVSSHTNPSTPARVVLQAEAGTVGTDTTVQANSSAFSGSGSNSVRSTFATNTAMVPRASWSLNLKFGTYKVLARVRKSGGVAEFTARWRLDVGSGRWRGKTVAYGATTTAGPHWLDLGQVSIPAGRAIPPGMTSGLGGTLHLEAGRSSASGSLDADCVVLVPTEIPNTPRINTSITWQQYGYATSGQEAVLGLNAEDDEEWTYTNGLVGFTALRRGGGLPRVYPGHDNHLVVMRHVGTIPGGSDGATVPADALTTSTTVLWSYRPRYLYLSEPDA